MIVELEKGDLINLVKGIVPYYDVFENSLVKENGHYIGGFHDKWVWDDSSLFKLSEEELIEIYKTCKQSWK